MEVWQLGLLLFAGLVLFFFLLGRMTWGTGADLLDWDPTERTEAKRILEHEDTAHLVETMNRRRRAQGLPELAEDDVLGTLDDDRRRRGEA